MGFEKILLVEGPTEVRTMHEFLRKLGAERQFVFLPLSGSSLINAGAAHHLEEVKRITQNVAAIIDSECDAAGAAISPQRQAFADACQELRIPCLILERRAVENYLSDAAIKSVKGEKYFPIGPYQRLETVDPAWSKEENWKIAREMEFTDIADTDLGKFIRELVN